VIIVDLIIMGESTSTRGRGRKGKRRYDHLGTRRKVREELTELCFGRFPLVWKKEEKEKKRENRPFSGWLGGKGPTGGRD